MLIIALVFMGGKLVLLYQLNDTLVCHPWIKEVVVNDLFVCLSLRKVVGAIKV